MDKNSFLLSKYLSKNYVALVMIMGMLIGFLCSRSIASIAMFLFGVNALRDIPPRKWLSQKWYLLGLVWVGLFAISWFWSSNKEEWGAHFQVKLPYLFLPLAFGFIRPWTAGDLKKYTVMLAGTMILGACYSISFFLRDPHGLIAGYRYSHILPTPAYRDHISFSTAVAATVAWCFYVWPLFRSRLARAALFLTVLFLIIYLHLLAAKTGLLALYVFLGGYFVYYLIAKSWRKGLLIGLAMIGTLAVFYVTIPTFHERIGYISYTWIRFNEGERSGLYSDMGRIISYDLSAKIIAQHPLIGTGAGDMLDEMGRAYLKWYPHIPSAQWLLPHNQFLTVAIGIGLPGMLFFIWWVIAPLKRVRRNREGFFFLMMWLLLLVPLFTDPFLEVQFGVFVYLFFLLMQRSLLLQAIPAPTETDT